MKSIAYNKQSAFSTLLFGAPTGVMMVLLLGDQHILIMNLPFFSFASPASVIQTCMSNNFTSQVVNVLKENLVCVGDSPKIF